MNKLYCTNPDCKQTPVRSRVAFTGKEKCPTCKKPMGINIKGSALLFTHFPSDPVRVPRRFRSTMKNGSPCNKSAINGAKVSSNSAI